MESTNLKCSPMFSVLLHGRSVKTNWLAKTNPKLTFSNQTIWAFISVPPKRKTKSQQTRQNFSFFFFSFDLMSALLGERKAEMVQSLVNKSMQVKEGKIWFIELRCMAHEKRLRLVPGSSTHSGGGPDPLYAKRSMDTKEASSTLSTSLYKLHRNSFSFDITVPYCIHM